MEPGLFVTFLNKDEPRQNALPPVGPLDTVVLRKKQLIAQRTKVHQPEDSGVPIERWLEAELEFGRATGDEPGGMKRTHMRFSSRDGLYVRFLAYGDAQEQRHVAELGPFDLVTIGPREVEAEGRVLARLAVSDFPTWSLTADVSEDVAGLYKPDIALRADGGAYHPAIGAPPATVLPEARTVVPVPAIVPTHPVSPPAPQPDAVKEEPAALAAKDLELIQRIEREQVDESLRRRIYREERQRASATAEPATWSPRTRSPAPSERPHAAATSANDPFSFGELLWRSRFAILGVLLVAVLTYAAAFAIRTAAPSGAQYRTINLTQSFSGTRWDFTVQRAQRMPASGSVRARGTFIVAYVAATNKGSEGLTLAPSDFTLIDASGAQYLPVGQDSDVYQGSSNPTSPHMWPRHFPVGRAVTLALLFDVDPALPGGNQLAIADAPQVRVKID